MHRCHRAPCGPAYSQRTPSVPRIRIGAPLQLRRPSCQLQGWSPRGCISEAADREHHSSARMHTARPPAATGATNESYDCRRGPGRASGLHAAGSCRVHARSASVAWRCALQPLGCLQPLVPRVERPQRRPAVAQALRRASVHRPELRRRLQRLPVTHRRCLRAWREGVSGQNGLLPSAALRALC